AEDGIRDFHVTGVQTCALPISQMTKAPTAPDIASTPLPHSASIRNTPPAPARVRHRAGPASRCERRYPPRWRRSAPWETAAHGRSEERRVGKEGRGRWAEDRCK